MQESVAIRKHSFLDITWHILLNMSKHTYSIFPYNVHVLGPTRHRPRIITLPPCLIFTTTSLSPPHAYLSRYNLANVATTATSTHLVKPPVKLFPPSPTSAKSSKGQLAVIRSNKQRNGSQEENLHHNLLFTLSPSNSGYLDLPRTHHNKPLPVGFPFLSKSGLSSDMPRNFFNFASV